MRPLNTLPPLVAGLVIVLTYLLLQGTAPDPRRHEGTLDALRSVILNNAALQRDVLRARAGLLRSYDPLILSLAGLHAATAGLAGAADAASGERRADIERMLATVAAAVSEQEALVELFKSDNALVQNSLTYFNFTSGRLATGGDGLQEAEMGALTAAMLRFVNDPQPDTANGVTSLLDRLAGWPDRAVLGSDISSLAAHGRLIVTTLPALDDVVARLQASATSERAEALQDAYLDAHGRAAARADFFLTLLYIAALALVAYIAYLFVRLHAKAEALRDRLEFEELIASISSQFINLPGDRIRDGVGHGLRRLVEHFGLDGAQIVVRRAGEARFAESYTYYSPASDRSSCRPEALMQLALEWRPEGFERQGCICVPDVRVLPNGREKLFLQGSDVGSWLCIPLWYAGERLGFLVLQAVRNEKRWPDEGIAQLRTAAEIFANAIARECSEAEREALQARLNQSQRLEAVGTLASGIAHEFNNILGAILGYGEMALAVLSADSAAERYVRQIMKAGDRAEDIVEQVLAFGRRREREHRPVAAEAVVAEAIDLIRASFPATLSVSARLHARDALVMGDPTELQQVVVNLGTNAAQAMQGRGVIEIELDTVVSDDGLKLSHGDLPPGRFVRLAVRDSGCGMDQATIDRIFEPFFTTKPPGQGTGLGLSTVHGIVTEHGGTPDVGSKPGEGTVFKVYLPRIEGVAASEEKSAEAPVRRGHGETIMIVDDDRSLVLLGEEMLAALGYEPVGFDSSRAALRAFRADPGRFDLLLTDEVMPALTGTELAAAFYEIRRDLPIVLMSGDARPAQAGRRPPAGIREALRKPLRSRTIADCLARQLSPGRAATAIAVTPAASPGGADGKRRLAV